MKKTLIQIQQEFAPAKKAEGHGYKYSNLNTILPRLKDLGASYYLKLSKVEMIESSTFTQTTLNKKEREMFRVILKTTWKFKFEEDEEEQIEMVSSGTQNSLDMAFGSAITYARRYLLLNVFNANDGGEFDPEKIDAPPKPNLDFSELETSLKQLKMDFGNGIPNRSDFKTQKSIDLINEKLKEKLINKEDFKVLKDLQDKEEGEGGN